MKQKRSIHGLRLSLEEVESQVGRLLRSLYPMTYSDDPNLIEPAIGARFVRDFGEFERLVAKARRLSEMLQELEDESR